MNIDIGDLFHVTETVEARTERGRLVARFLPGHGYSATMLNAEHIRAAAAEGKVGKGLPPGAQAGVSVGQVSGSVNNGEGAS